MREGLHERPVPELAGFDRRLGRLLGGDVPEIDGDAATGLWVDAERCPAFQDRRERFEVSGLPLGHCLTVVCMDDASLDFREDVEEIVVQQLFACFSEQLQGALVDISEPPLPVDGVESVPDAFENRGGAPLGRRLRLQLE